MSEITPEKRERLRKHASEWVEMGDVCHIKPETMLGLLDALERAEARADGGLMEELKRANALTEKKEAMVKLLEKELAGADAEISSLRDELEDSRGMERDAPNVLCAIARLVGVYEHCQELGDDVGEMTLDAVRDLLAEKQKYDPRALRWTNEPPKVAGWYWWRTSKGQNVNTIQVWSRSGVLGYCFDTEFITTLDRGEWAGPIPAPID